MTAAWSRGQRTAQVTLKLDWQDVFSNGTDPLPQPKLVPGKGCEQKNARKFSQ